jgi:hypothetical protein
MGSSSNVAACPGSCTTTPWGIAGAILNPFDLVAVHGTAPGGEAFMPVWGYQANVCGVHGLPTTDADGNPIRSWATCTPNPHDLCLGVQDSDEADFDPPSCNATEGCGNTFCTSDFTSAWPYLDNNAKCTAGSGTFIDGFTDPSRIDFVNNVSVYRAPIVWETKSDEGLDDDYTMNMHSPGGELYDTQHPDARVHIEFDSDETIDHFTDDSFGPANEWWRALRAVVDSRDDEQRDRDVRCFMRAFVNPGLTCPQPDGVEPPGHDPVAVVVGIPAIDCADHPDANTSEIHPAYAVAIRIQEDPGKPEQWAFFYRRRGDNGGCGSKTYGRCSTTFQLPLSFPAVPSGKVLKSADVHVDAHPWAVDDSPGPDVTVDGHFDLTSGTVVTINLPGEDEGVVGLVTVTPVVDTTPPQITCPANITTPQDPGTCTAVTTFSPTFSDDCSASVVCSPPSGTAFPLGATTDTCTVTDQAGLSASCSFTVTVKDTTPPTIDSIAASPSTLWPPNHKLVPVSIRATATDLCDASPTCMIVSVSSNEPVLGPGSGHTDPDWVITDPGPKPSPSMLGVQLRPERAGGGTGRTYTIDVSCADASGNTTAGATTVTVPHDQGH